MIRDALGQFEQVATEAIGKAARDFAIYPIDVQAKLLTLMQDGWAVDPDQPILFIRMAEGAFEKDEAAETWITNHFEGRLHDIQTALAKRHPERTAILRDAFDAHRQGAYTLSVPVLLAQADGIVGERYKRKQLFSKSKHHGLASDLKEMEPTQLSTIWAEVLSGKAEVSSNVRDLPANFSGLNRHAVLHGTDLNYGCRTNSLKAVSILYMASHLVLSDTGP